MGTSTIEKGGWLIAVTGIMQAIAVIDNIIASWTIIIVMHIIITLINCALIVDYCRMMMLQATPHWRNKMNELHIPQYYQWWWFKI